MADRVISVIKTSREESDATDIALLVSTSSKSEVNIWDKTKIVDSMMRETGASLELANEIATAVERKILDSNFEAITTSIIRELIDLELLERNLSMMHKKHSHLGLPMYDVEHIILNANKENSNTTHNPESINLTIAETILKDFALRRVFSEDVALAHLMGDVHLHDLGFIVRPYTYMGDSVVVCRRPKEIEKLISIKQLYESLPFEFQAEEGVWVKRPLGELYLADKDGAWTKVTQLTKKAKADKRMHFIRTSDGKQQVVTDDHPMITTRGVKPCRKLRVGEELYTENHQFRSLGIQYLNLVEEFVAAAVSGTRYSFVMEETVPWSKIQSDVYVGNAAPDHYQGGYIVPTQQTGGPTPVSFPLSEELGWVLGYFIAEGYQTDHSLSFNGDGESTTKLLKCLDAMGLTYEYRRRQRVTVKNCLIRDLFVNVWKVGTTARTKALPVELHAYGQEFIRAVVAGIVDGRGASAEGPGVCVKSTSATLVNQLSQVLGMLGLKTSARRPAGVSTVRELDGRAVTQRYPVWSVFFYKDSDVELPSLKYSQISVKCGAMNIDKPGFVTVTHLETVDIPDEFIYDITTESHTFQCNGIYSHNCGGHSLEYIKKFGISLPNITSTSKPARHAEVLIGHMVKMASSLQAHYAGAIGWEAVNMFFAPYLVGRSYEEIKQLAQMLIYEFNQLAGARGSQVTFTDFNLYWNIPRHFRDTEAVGPGGQLTGRMYSEYEKESQAFVKAMFEIYLEGDAIGKTFVFPKPLLHINEDFFKTEGWEEFLELACLVASRQGITYFVFDRGDETTVSQCCRLKLRLGEKDLEETKTPEKMRFSALQNITINLPRIAYKAQGNEELLFAEVNRALEIVAKAHLQKKQFIKSLIDLDKDGPLALLCGTMDGEQYLRLDRLTYLAGVFGLNEMVQAHTGRQLHEGDEALKFGLRVISHMNIKCRHLSEQYGIKIVLEESPAESSGYRLAKLDMKYYPEQAKKVMKGAIETGEYYYTNSIHLAVDADVDYIGRVEKQSLFHPLIDAGAIVHIWLGEHEPSPSSIRNFVMKTFHNTHCAQIAFSPEFTVCNGCGRTSRGLTATCPLCDSEDVYGTTRIVGYYSKIPTWNKGKVGELRDRIRTDLSGQNGKAEEAMAGSC